MKIEGKITMSQYGVFMIDTPLLDTAKALRDADELPKSVTIELEALKPYTIGGVPIVFKMKPKAKKKGS
ncbi:hypothetical protein LCGC14_2856180 [marine sediment metagenome]|uniref:Uncharacterized protein n=1 Tax=marine sediment metagenome TaxID=412755 RepID=A0A0F9AXV7_9ZZZZ